ncbi:MAG: hypothetical protein FP825_00360 [Hyphomonas sp.]|uniref:Zn-ribbon domain-containing OB-fold protein n=1 Tax=Hyphomonas sp. TaxID=87 RepID=UPI00182CD3FB|nr:OB-fold domain-containing protein [Hyphomonas sp.]MBU3919145.1 OB-fold domain-containing protein [Alphaproteobacteria bacterium]MBA3066918.1 hypothetical protein [Hyphomonas sp.]MBU4060578.1 OB-fold domain-containing protein [Alphaproteobacteria bacterium]MBU4165846.1 OB-fold domain-containing protein [Alphaproteobacteria bacterium]MBU4569277.1 OB-fold domain-containing protein [Alphaproteobacteria bacterium]
MSAAPHDEQEKFWQAAAGGQLMLGRCIDTGKPFFYPRDHSPFTGGPADTITASGRGTVYAHSVAYRAKEPYCIAYVQLEEGPIVMSNILADDLSGLEAIRIGDSVTLVFEADASGRMTPFFRRLTTG